MIKPTIFILAILTVSNCNLGVVTEVSDSKAATAFPCIFKTGYIDVTVEVESSPTQVVFDNTGLQNLNKAKNTFSKVSLTFVSCRGRDPIKQADQFVKKIPSNLYTQAWVYLGQQSLWYQCSPSSYTPQQNCNYMHQLLGQLKKAGVNVGVAAEEVKWRDQFGTTCTDLGSYPLFWVPTQDNDPSFSSFKPFGGFKTPAVKVYKNGVDVCGANVDLSYRP